ncbi:MAG: response regulator transcription factor [Anaerolineales bacterium]|nr:response regulator transcription factor [Anaerolineales bacterium]
MSVYKVLIVDDHSVVRRGLRSTLDPDPRFEVVGEAGTGKAALERASELAPDIVILDLKLPDMKGSELCRQLLLGNPDLAVLILTGFFDHNLVDACLRAGARGYLLKDAENLRLEEHLMAVVQGQGAFDPRTAGALADMLRQTTPHPDTLNPRELQILHLIADGMTNKEIALYLHLSENTIKSYVRDLMAKLDVRNRVEAVVRAQERGII